MRLLCLDSNVIIYALSGQKPHDKTALDVLRKIDAGLNFTAVFSYIIYSEVIGFSKNIRSTEPAHTFISGMHNTFLAPIDLKIAQTAGVLRQRYGSSLKLGDAIHLATALENNADFFITNDLPLAKIAKKITPTMILSEWHKAEF